MTINGTNQRAASHLNSIVLRESIAKERRGRGEDDAMNEEFQRVGILKANVAKQRMRPEIPQRLENVRRRRKIHDHCTTGALLFNSMYVD